MEFLLIPAFAILNRWRGSDWPHTKAPFIAKVLCGAILGYLLGAEWWMYPLMFGTYWAGENFGWGSWIGSILEKRAPEKKAWPPIDNLVTRLVQPYEDPLLYSTICLFLRGAFWWVPIFFTFYLFNICALWEFFVAAFACSAGFPASIFLAKEILNTDVVKTSAESDRAWRLAEIIYGAIQGGAVAAVWYF